MLQSGGISRAQLKREMHLSFLSVSALVDELLASNLTDCTLIPLNFEPSVNTLSDGKLYPDMLSLCDSFLSWFKSLRSTYNVPALILSTPGTFNKDGVLSSSSMCISTPPDFLSYLSKAAEIPVYQGNISEHYAYGEYHCSRI